MLDTGGEFFESALTVGNLDAEQILMISVKRLPLQIFVGSISDGYRRTRQHIFDPPAKARLFPLGVMECVFDCLQNGGYARPVGFGVSTGRARPKIPLAWPTPGIIRARPWKKLKHQDDPQPLGTMLLQVTLSWLRNSEHSPRGHATCCETMPTNSLNIIGACTLFENVRLSACRFQPSRFLPRR
jgi:hypothetical protein